MRVAILTVSTAGALGSRKDTSGDAIAEWVGAHKHALAARELVPDDVNAIVQIASVAVMDAMGREDIITDMKASRAERAADADKTNDPPPVMHHVMTNAVIDIVSADKALHHCYWMTVSGGPQMYSFRVAAEGGYEDELVKRDGAWLIHRRKIVE